MGSGAERLIKASAQRRLSMAEATTLLYPHEDEWIMRVLGNGHVRGPVSISALGPLPRGHQFTASETTTVNSEGLHDGSPQSFQMAASWACWAVPVTKFVQVSSIHGHLWRYGHDFAHPLTRYWFGMQVAQMLRTYPAPTVISVESTEMDEPCMLFVEHPDGPGLGKPYSWRPSITDTDTETPLDGLDGSRGS